jgi:hypothetical protein
MEEVLRSIFSSQLHVLLIVAALLIILAELGFRSAFLQRPRAEDKYLEHIGTIHGAVLGLLALLLGFTFAMVVQRYDLRRDLVVEEANAIGTTFLRASFLPEPHRGEVQGLLRRYIDTRLDFYRAGEDETKLSAAETASAAIQRQLWIHATLAGELSATPLVATFVTSLNETIDLDASRLAAMRNRVPMPVWLLLLLVAGCGCWLSGYSSRGNGTRSGFSQVLLPVLITLVITILTDLATPRRGLVGVSQQSLVDLKESLGQEKR